MYAVIETGGKQYRVEMGSELAIERLDAHPGDTVSFDRVLLVADGDNAQVGTPLVDEAVVTASVLRQDRGEKVIVFKYRPKARHRSKKGHRQEQTVIRIADIRLGGRSAADEASAEEKQESKARKAAIAEAERKAAADQALAAKLAEEAATTEEAQAEAPAKPAKAAKPAARSKADTAPAEATETAPAETAPAKRARAKPTTKAAPEADSAPVADPAPAKKPSTRRSTTKKDEN